MELINKLSTLCETYRGHDQALSLVGYNCKMLCGLYSKKNPKLSAKLNNISSQISNARVILRLLDDFSMLSYSYSYGLGKHEKSLYVRILNVINNLASHLYYICEHIAWLSDNGIFNFNSGIYWLVSLLAWLISLITTILCNFITIKNQLIDPNWKTDKFNLNKLKRIMLHKNMFKIYLKLIEDISYTINCIHWLPPGVLWSSKLSDFWSGFLGVLSVVCCLSLKIIASSN